MKLKISVASTAFALLVMAMPAAIGSSAQRVGRYDFSYLTSGELRATPVQVFDDGKSTFFQFRAGDAIPVVFSNKDGKTELLVPTFEGPYVRVPEMGGRFTLQLGRAQAQVVYSGGGREGVPTINAVSSNGMSTAFQGGAYPADQNVRLVASLAPATAPLNADSLEANSYATPVKGDKVTWKDSETKTAEHAVWFAGGSQSIKPAAVKQLISLAASFKNATRVTVVGRDDESFKEGLEQARANAIRNVLVKAGVPVDRIYVKTGVHGESKKGMWASDIRVETAIPTQISRPSEAQQATAGNPERSSYVKANIEGLVQTGVITRDQAQAMLRKYSDQSSVTKAQAQAPAVQTPTLKNPDAPVDGFDLRASDRTVSGTMRRWAAATNYQIVWDAPATSDAPITGDASLGVTSMKDALEKVVSGLQSKGYDIQAMVYSNRVIRFTGSSK